MKTPDCGHDTPDGIFPFVCTKCGFYQCAECNYRTDGKCWKCGKPTEDKTPDKIENQRFV